MQNTEASAQTERNSDAFLSDKEIAKILGLSAAWCRRQRHLRAKGEKHVLIIDPVYVGTSPRYRSSEVRAWLESL